MKIHFIELNSLRSHLECAERSACFRHHTAAAAVITGIGGGADFHVTLYSETRMGLIFFQGGSKAWLNIMGAYGK